MGEMDWIAFRIAATAVLWGFISYLVAKEREREEDFWFYFGLINFLLCIVAVFIFSLVFIWSGL